MTRPGQSPDYRENEGDETTREVIRYGKIGCAAVGGIAGIVALFSSFYTVGSSEVGIETRLGVYDQTTGPGLHFKVPFLEGVRVMSTQEIQRTEVGFRTLEEPGADGTGGEYRTADSDEEMEHEAKMLTADENIVMVSASGQYRVVDPKDWMFNAANPKDLVQNAMESAVRQVVGNHSIDEVLTTGKEAMQSEIASIWQALLNEYDIGVDVANVQLQNPQAPSDVSQAFTDVQNAEQEREQRINEGQGYLNERRSAAEGQRRTLLEDAEGYKSQRINTATGDVAWFSALLEEYERSPEVTRERLYIETMKEIYPQLRIFIMDEGSDNGLLQFLDLTREESP